VQIMVNNLEVCKLDREGGIRAHSRHDKVYDISKSFEAEADRASETGSVESI
jgi:hypothetical protein